MARLWTCGFELASAGSGIEIASALGTTAPTIVSSGQRSGLSALLCQVTAGTSYFQHRYRADSTARIFVRMAFGFGTNRPNVDTRILGQSDGTTTGPEVMYRAATNTLQVRNLSATYVGSTSSVISTGTYYVLQYDYDDASGLVSAWLNGVQFCNNAAGGSLAGGGTIVAGLSTGTPTADMYIDDFAINDSSGTAENGLPDKDAKVIMLAPTAAGDNNLFATAVGGTAGTANNWTRVDEWPPDDSTTYNQTTATGTATIDDFNMFDPTTSFIPSTDTIKMVGVGIRVGSNGTTAASLVARLKNTSGGTLVESASISCSVNGWRTGGVVTTGNPQPWANIITYVNPATGSAWTPAELNNVQAGYRANVSQTSTRRVTDVWVIIEHTPTSSTPANISAATIAPVKVTVSGTAQAGAGVSFATIAPVKVAVSGTVQTSANATPGTVPISTHITISGTALTSSTVPVATVPLSTNIVVTGAAQAGAIATPATIAPVKVTVSGTAQASTTVAPSTVAPLKVVISGAAQTQSAVNVAVASISPVKVVISGAPLTSVTLSPGTITPVKVAVSGTVQAGAVAVVTSLTPPVVVISGTAQGGARVLPGSIIGTVAIGPHLLATGSTPLVATVLPPTVSVSGSVSTGAAPTPSTIAPLAVVISGAGSTSEEAAPIGVRPPKVVISGVAQAGWTITVATVAPPAANVGAVSILTGSTVSLATILGEAAITTPTVTAPNVITPLLILCGVTISGTAVAVSSITASVSTLAPPAVAVSGTASASSLVQAFTISPPRVVVGTVVIATPASAMAATIAGQVAIGPHLMRTTASVLAATILGLVSIARPSLGNPVVEVGEPVVTGSTHAPSVVGLGAASTLRVTGDVVRARIDDSSSPSAGVS